MAGDIRFRRGRAAVTGWSAGPEATARTVREGESRRREAQPRAGRPAEGYGTAGDPASRARSALAYWGSGGRWRGLRRIGPLEHTKPGTGAQQFTGTVPRALGA